MKQTLVSLKNLSISVSENQREKVLVDEINLDIPENTTVALVGGSGSGKTTTGLSILRLLPLGLNIINGQIYLRGESLVEAKEERMQKLRGKEISMVFQEPLNAFNPVMTIGAQVDEVMLYHTSLNAKQRKERSLELLDIVGLPDPKRIFSNYPHQLSGGMRQRAMIAQSLAASPKLIIADEPTSNLDVTLQAKVMELFVKLKETLNVSILLITHDIGLVKHFTDEVAVMTKGQIVESGKTLEILNNPQHEYTKKLMEAVGE